MIQQNGIQPERPHDKFRFDAELFFVFFQLNPYWLVHHIRNDYLQCSRLLIMCSILLSKLQEIIVQADTFVRMVEARSAAAKNGAAGLLARRHFYTKATGGSAPEITVQPTLDQTFHLVQINADFFKPLPETTVDDTGALIAAAWSALSKVTVVIQGNL